ncbi:MAG: carboxypeptidase regulatory-like domain-containing protein [Bacteroidaceae bacterium]|nr:carboxypeptidase regulatory-like domain-containing protein [Bacteroidaceae bacterium]
MKQNRLFVALCAMMLTTGVMAQTNASSQKTEKMTFEGRIVDAKSKVPIPKVDVTIMSADSAVLTSWPTWSVEGEEGKFSFNLMTNTLFIFKFSKEGYETLFINKEVKRGSQDSNFDFGLGNATDKFSFGDIGIKRIHSCDSIK